MWPLQWKQYSPNCINRRWRDRRYESIATDGDYKECGESLIGVDLGKIHGLYKIRGHVMSVTIT